MADAKLGDVVGKLNLGGVVGGLTGSLSNLTKPGGALAGVQIPATHDDMAGATEGASKVDTSGIAATVEQLANQLLPLVAKIPGAGDILGPIESALQMVEQVAGGDLLNDLKAFSEKLTAELSGARQGGFLGTLERLLDLVQGAGEIKALLGLVRTLIGAAGLNPSLGQAGVVLNAIPAAVNSARAVGALMALESSLAEAERLTAVMSEQLA
ncbi:MAG TPA: hypothetical protein VND93_11680, partial [Myxococcales bacterium]|nr:hypothetical protein [Myxococcales bacterium]